MNSHKELELGNLYCFYDDLPFGFGMYVANIDEDVVVRVHMFEPMLYIGNLVFLLVQTGISVVVDEIYYHDFFESIKPMDEAYESKQHKFRDW